MPKPSPTNEAQAAKKVQPKPQVAPEQTGGELALAELASGPFGMADTPTTEGQARRLGDPRLHAIQRQMLAGKIGQVQGNGHLQQIMASLKQDEPNAPYQPNTFIKPASHEAIQRESDRDTDVDEKSVKTPNQDTSPAQLSKDKQAESSSGSAAKGKFTDVETSQAVSAYTLSQTVDRAPGMEGAAQVIPAVDMTTPDSATQLPMEQEVLPQKNGHTDHELTDAIQPIGTTKLNKDVRRKSEEQDDSAPLQTEKSTNNVSLFNLKERHNQLSVEKAAQTEVPVKVQQRREREGVIQRSLLDDFFSHLRTGNAIVDFVLGVVAGILEWIGDLISGLISLASGLLELLAEADRGNIWASLGVIGLIILIVLACAFPEVSVPILIGVGVVMGVLHLAYHLAMLFNPLLTAYQKGKHLGKAIAEGVLLFVSVLELVQFAKAFRGISEFAEGAGAMQKIRWIMQLRRYGNIETVLAVVEEAGSIDKAIQLLEIVKNADKALQLISAERNADTLLEILRIEGVTADEALRLLGKPGMTGSILKNFLRNADGAPRMSVADLDQLLSNSKIADNVAQLQSLMNHAKIRNLAQLKELLGNAKIATAVELQGLLDSAKISTVAELQGLLDSAKISTVAELQGLLGNAKIATAVELQGLLDSAKISTVAELQGLLGNAKITTVTELQGLLGNAKIVNTAELQGLLNNAKITTATELQGLLDNAKIVDATELHNLLNNPKIPNVARLEQLLNADITNNAAELDRLLRLVNAVDDVELYVMMAGGKGEIASLEALLIRAVAKGDVKRVEDILNCAASNATIFQKLADSASLFSLPPIANPGMTLPTPRPPYIGLTPNASAGHFLDHTFEYINFPSRLNKQLGTTLWPAGTTPAAIETHLQNVVDTLTATTPPTVITPGVPLNIPVGTFTVQVGTQGTATNLRIGQFFPTPAGGGIHFTMAEINALWKLLQ